MSPNEDMMNCEDYKRALTAEPEFEDESGHTDSCAPCRVYAVEIATLNANIAQAMELDVPELRMPELPDIDTEEVVSLPARRVMPKAAWFAIAATVVFAAFVGLRTTSIDGAGATLERQVLAHVDHAPAALKPSTVPVSGNQLAEVVPATVATMNHDSGLITFAESCPINGNAVPHIVIQGERGPVTILLMPEEAVQKARFFEGVNIKGVILPVGSGSIAIIGDREEQLEKYEKNVLNSVTWDT